jgi:hypothetical protein
MSRAHPARIVLIALLALLALPATTLAADPVTVSGTVTRDGTPVGGVEVVATVDASDLVLSTSTGTDGTFSFVIDAGVGSQVVLRATGPTSTTGPDNDGCVHHETPIGSVTLTLETLTPEPVALALDKVITSTVCSATGKPEVTPPSTDGVMPTRPQAPGDGTTLAVLTVLGILAGVLLMTRRRRAGPRTRA